MDYKEALKYLEKSYGIGYKHTLDVFRKVVYNLRNPQEKLKIIHVGGTNGKGSTCSMLRNVLTASGYRVGLFTSPHLDRVNERLSIDGMDISDDDFAKTIFAVKKATEEYNISVRNIPARDLGIKHVYKDQIESLAFFEILTAAAFKYFYENNVDYVIMEVGLGGRLDATNIIEKPILTIITSISIDHTEYLGEKIEQIATEKAGIIKGKSPLVLCYQSDKVYNIIKEVCARKNIEIYYSDDIETDIIADDENHLVLNIKTNYFSYKKIEIKLLGSYQLENLKTVLMALYVLQRNGLNISENAVKSGLLRTVWPGRMEVINKKPIIIVDGAHNIDAVRLLKESLIKYFGENKITLVIGILKDKDFSAMINIMADLAEKIILTKPKYDKRVVEPEELYKTLNDKEKKIEIENDYKKAIDLAIEMTSNEGLICCTGSLYLVGDIRKYVLEAFE